MIDDLRMQSYGKWCRHPNSEVIHIEKAGHEIHQCSVCSRRWRVKATAQ